MKMDAATRAAWLDRRSHQRVTREVQSGLYECDTCVRPAAAISHSGDGSPVIVECPKCFLLRIEKERAVRPSRAELVARVNAAVGV